MMSRGQCPAGGGGGVPPLQEILYPDNYLKYVVLYKSIGNAQPDLCVLSNGHIINYDLCKVLMCHFPQILKNYILSIDHINLC